MKRALVLLVTLAAWMTVATRAVDRSRAIQFPDVPGYRTLVVDLHTHSVFSDGMVWPDIHGLVDWDYGVHDGGHRTVTLVFAEDRTAASVHAALDAGRTVAWYRNTLIGREPTLGPLLRSALTVSAAAPRGDTRLVDVTLTNTSDAAFELRPLDGHRFYDQDTIVRVPPHDRVVIGVTGKPRPRFELEFEVLNALTAPERHPSLALGVRVARP